MPLLSENQEREQQHSGDLQEYSYDHASPYIYHSTIRYSSRRGIYASYSSSHISNCAINHNSGGIYLNNSSNVIIEGSTIESNSVDIGGGIYCNGGTATIRGNTINNNTATYNSSDLSGGGIFGYYATVSISGNTISGNNYNDNVIDMLGLVKVSQNFGEEGM